jgi:arylsulfatase A-like enzyme
LPPATLTPFLLALQAAGGAPGVAPSLPATRHPANLLIVVADDLGVDQLAAYGEGQSVPVTPTLDALAQGGVLFRNAYGYAYCSPTRAAIMTGRHPFRTGMGTYMQPGEESAFALQPEEVTLPEMLASAPHAHFRCAAFGKWHLGNATVGGSMAPNLAGFQHFEGIDGNIAAPYDYSFWPKTVDGVQQDQTVYATTDTVDSALAWIGTAPEPWFAYVAFNSNHTPLHIPPDGLYTSDVSTADPHFNPRPFFVAMAEAADAELGRLLDGLGPERQRTNVIFLGDNGSPEQMVVAPIPPYQCKGSFYEGGIGVPLIVSGPAVLAPGTEVGAMVQVTDLFATAAELAGVQLSKAVPADHPLDSLSLVPFLRDPAAPPLRSTVFSQLFSPNGFGEKDEWFETLRGERYKLVEQGGSPDRLFDLLLDPYETNDLLLGTPTTEELAEYDALKGALLSLLQS